MSNDRSVKMFTLIDGKPSEIGQCHAGQARLLRKKGLAEWKDGKLWLLTPAPSTVNITLPPGADSEDVLTALANGWPATRRATPDQTVEKAVRTMAFRSDPEYLEAILEEAGIDTEEWDVMPTSHSSVYTEVIASGCPALFYEFRRRLGLGHETCSYSDSRTRTLGFLDLTANEYVFSPLTAIKEMRTSEADAEALGIPLDELREMIKFPEGRIRLFGHGGFGDPSAAAPEDDIDWGEMPPDVSSQFNRDVPVGLLRIAAPVHLPPLKAEEDAQARLDCVLGSVREAYRFDLVPVPGWTYFRADGAHAVIPVLAAGEPHPAPDPAVYGLYKRVGSYLFRVWVQGRDAGWDESALEGDCTYRLSVEHSLPGQPAHEHVEESLRLVKLRLQELRADADTSHEVGPGWTKFFTFEDAPAVFYMDIPPDLTEELNKSPYRSTPMTEDEATTFAARMVRSPYAKLHGEKSVYGFYQVVGDRLFRVLGSHGESSVWDESVRAPDGTYTLQSEGRSIDKIRSTMSNTIELLAPSGFPDTLKAAERRIAEYLASPDGKWVTTRHNLPGGYLYKS